MIYRILNLAEVEQGIRERAERDARAPGGSKRISELAIHAQLLVERALELDATIGPHRPAGALWWAMPVLERDRLQHIALAATHAALAEVRADQLESMIEASADAMMCNLCGAPSDAAIHQMIDESTHTFVCIHGQEVSLAVDCIMDHPDVA